MLKQIKVSIYTLQSVLLHLVLNVKHDGKNTGKLFPVAKL